MASTTAQDRRLDALADEAGINLRDWTASHPLAKRVVGGHGFNRREADIAIAELQAIVDRRAAGTPAAAPQAPAAPAATQRQVDYLADLYAEFAVAATPAQRAEWARLTRRQASQLISEYQATARGL